MLGPTLDPAPIAFFYEGRIESKTPPRVSDRNFFKRSGLFTVKSAPKPLFHAGIRRVRPEVSTRSKLEVECARA